MKFIVDTHLPPRLARVLTQCGHPSWHVGELAALDTSDPEIWALAKAEDCAVMTKDSDFLRLSIERGGAVPVLLLRVGNCSRDRIIEIVSARLHEVVAAFEAGEAVIEIR